MTSSKLGDAWYVSNVCIIFYCSMLLYYLFWMLMGLILHFYIIFGTNLLTQGPMQIAIFFPISVLHRKGISNRVQTEWNLRERDFWNKRDPEDLEWTSRNHRGGHEAGGAPQGGGRAPTLVSSSFILWRRVQAYPVGFLPKITSPVDFVPFWLRLIFLFLETLK